MGHGVGESLHFPIGLLQGGGALAHPLLQGLVEAAHFQLDALALGHVAHHRYGLAHPAMVQGVEADLGGKHCAVLAPDGDLAPAAHDLHRRSGEERFHIDSVGAAHPLRHQEANAAAHQFLAPITEGLFRPDVGQLDGAVAADDQDRVRCRLDHALEQRHGPRQLCFHGLARRNVAEHHHHPVHAALLHHGAGDQFRDKGGAVAAAHGHGVHAHAGILIFALRDHAVAHGIGVPGGE